MNCHRNSISKLIQHRLTEFEVGSWKTYNVIVRRVSFFNLYSRKSIDALIMNYLHVTTTITKLIFLVTEFNENYVIFLSVNDIHIICLFFFWIPNRIKYSNLIKTNEIIFHELWTKMMIKMTKIHNKYILFYFFSRKPCPEYMWWRKGKMWKNWSNRIDALSFIYTSSFQKKKKKLFGCVIFFFSLFFFVCCCCFSNH